LKNILIKKIKQISLKEKMRLYSWMVLIPLAALTIYTLFSMAGYYKQYDQIVRNITAANAYNISFKEDMDYTMYRIVIGSAKWSDPEEKLREEDPYEQINKIRKVFHQLYSITTTDSNKRKISMLLKTLNTLQERVDEIISNTKQAGHYDENMEKLDMNIRILTQIIQEQIQEYIYYEASSLESVRKEIADEANKTL
jgi:two-component system sensor histidine kinase YesM